VAYLGLPQIFNALHAKFRCVQNSYRSI